MVRETTSFFIINVSWKKDPVELTIALLFCAQQVAEKLILLSFRGTLRAEESLFFQAIKPREIPHFVRNDSESTFSANR
jgi:hypothetical protein